MYLNRTVEIICIYFGTFLIQRLIYRNERPYIIIGSTRNNANNNINKQRGKATKMQHIFIQTNILQI